MAGDVSQFAPLGRRFITVGRKLEKLDFLYHRGTVIVSEPEAAEPGRVSHASVARTWQRRHSRHRKSVV